MSFAKAIQEAQLGQLVDCPVSGGIFGAEDATLSSVMGGSEEDFKRVKPIMSTMADPNHIFHAGPTGSGLACKIINNYVATASFLALCEGMSGLVPANTPRLTQTIRHEHGCTLWAGPKDLGRLDQCQ